MKRLLYWRRRWCRRHGHPMADWSPTVMYWPAQYRLVGEVITETIPEIIVKQYRCALHDKP